MDPINLRYCIHSSQVIDLQEYRSLMSSSPYRRVTDEIENGTSYGSSH